MNGITLWVAFVDAVPAVIFLIASLILMKDFRDDIKFSNGAKGLWDYTFLAASAFMLFGGAILKVSWKVMYALNMCDYYTLSESFFPMQTIGFVLMGMGILGHLCKDNKKAQVARSVITSVVFVAFLVLTMVFTKSAGVEAVATASLEPNQVLPYESHMPFLLSTFVGMMICQVALMILCFKRKQKKVAMAFVVSMIFMVMQVVVGLVFDGTSGMHWVAQLTNIVAQSCLLAGTWLLYRKRGAISKRK